MDEKERYMMEKEQEVLRKQSTIQLVSIMLVISMILNVILLFGFFQSTDEETDSIIEQQGTPIILYNNITLGNITIQNEIIVEGATVNTNINTTYYNNASNNFPS